MEIVQFVTFVYPVRKPCCLPRAKLSFYRGVSLPVEGRSSSNGVYIRVIREYQRYSK